MMTVVAERTGRPWYSKLLSLCFIVFCFEIGVFLVVFPWLDNAWEANQVANFAPWLADIWGNPFFRGALSGLGLVNIYISFLELLRLLRGHS
jgi:hypothetical protein